MIKLVKLLEKSLGYVKQDYKLVVFIDKTKHAELRQNRHEGDFISDDEIKKSVMQASQKIINMLVFDEIDVGDRIVVHRKKDDLNIVGDLRKQGQNILRFEVITVIKTDEFWNTKNSPVIQIK